ncbi:MAG TPA: hypothetical protein VFP44_17430 [Usitatibacter sp.]|nr:hypothetical protein [Usitatibacter sp.]
MKKIFTLAARLATRASVAAVASACLLVAIPAQAGIANTKHNLGAKGTGANHLAAGGTDEICVFCHTPHAADNSAPAPLWNKKLPDGTGYTTYANLGSSTIDGKILNVGSISLACLSCHDGTQAMDNVINSPGSGGYAADGGGAAGQNWSWAGSLRVDGDGKLINATDTLAMLGTDLSNDHPIGIQYCGGGQTTTQINGACVDPDFVAPTTRNINGKQVWWVDTSVGTAGREKTDMILYTRDFNTAVTGQPANAGIGPSVECGSCHDPHADQADTNSKAGATFLRIANNESKVCLACHVK